MYKSCAREQNKNIYWDDINVELLGKFVGAYRWAG